MNKVMTVWGVEGTCENGVSEGEDKRRHRRWEKEKSYGGREGERED